MQGLNNGTKIWRYWAFLFMFACIGEAVFLWSLAFYIEQLKAQVAAKEPQMGHCVAAIYRCNALGETPSGRGVI